MERSAMRVQEVAAKAILCGRRLLEVARALRSLLTAPSNVYQIPAVDPTASLLKRMMHQKRGPGRWFDTLFAYDDSRRQRALCALSLLVLLLITPLAYAHACDSTWIPGLYQDVADYDEVVLFLIETAAVSAPAMCGMVCPSGHARSQRPRTEVSRGPPPIELRPLRFCASSRLCNSASEHRIPHRFGRGPPLDTLKRIGPGQGGAF
jgi:hypothetical protein